MKCRTLLACLLCVCALSALWLVSCTMNGSIGAITQWTISGTAQYTGTPTAFVTLGAFYYQKGSGTPASSTPISNVVNLGPVVSTPTNFSLSIDTRNLSPAAGDSIWIQMWDDSITVDNQMDITESQAYCIPMPGDAVFATTSVCVFVFTGSNWYLGALPIQSVTKTGANITSLTLL